MSGKPIVGADCYRADEPTDALLRVLSALFRRPPPSPSLTVSHACVFIELSLASLTHIVYPGLIIRDDAASVGEYIGNYIAKRCVHTLHRRLSPLTCCSINDFKPTAERPFVLGLPTGSSPIPTYKHLIKLVKAGQLS